MHDLVEQVKKGKVNTVDFAFIEKLISIMVTTCYIYKLYGICVVEWFYVS